MDPRREKARTLKHQRRNRYGEHDKGSRKSIRRRKRWVNRAYRSAVNQTIDHYDAAAVDDALLHVNRPFWQKTADVPLGDLLLDAQLGEIEALVHYRGQHLLELFEQRLVAQDWHPAGIRVVMRQLHALHVQGRRWNLRFDAATANKVLAIMRQLVPALPDSCASHDSNRRRYPVVTSLPLGTLGSHLQQLVLDPRQYYSQLTRSGARSRPMIPRRYTGSFQKRPTTWTLTHRASGFCISATLTEHDCDRHRYAALVLYLKRIGRQIMLAELARSYRLPGVVVGEIEVPAGIAIAVSQDRPTV